MSSCQQQVTKQNLLALWLKAEKSNDMDEVESLYLQILTEPGLSFKLSAKDILDIRWNRAINLVPIANWYLNIGHENRPQPTRAMTCIQQALSELAICVKGYATSTEKNKAISFQLELMDMKKYVGSILQQRAAVIPPFQGPFKG